MHTQLSYCAHKLISSLRFPLLLTRLRFSVETLKPFYRNIKSILIAKVLVFQYRNVQIYNISRQRHTRIQFILHSQFDFDKSGENPDR